jgi:membrane protease YdiL (CAAX protease family)
MMAKLDRGLKWYVVIVFVLSFIIAGIIYFGGGLASPYVLLVYLFMYTPLISAVVVRGFITREGFRNTGLGIGKKKYYLAAWFVPFIIVILTLLVSAALGLGMFNFDPSLLPPAVQPMLEAFGNMPLQDLMYLFLFINTISAVTIGMLVTIGEEYGWRSYLIQKLMPFGKTKALVCMGIIWGLWHASFIAMGFNYGLGYALFPLPGIVMMCIFTTLLGIIFAWLRYASGSIWPCAMAHATINNTASAFALFYFASPFIGYVMGFMGFIFMGITILVLYKTGELDKIKPQGAA